MRLEGWLLDADYVTEGDRATVRLWCVNPDGEPFVVLDTSLEPYFYVIPTDGTGPDDHGLRRSHLFQFFNCLFSLFLLEITYCCSY